MDRDESEAVRLSRRAILGTLGIAGPIGLAGCSGTDEEPSETASPTPDNETTTSAETDTATAPNQAPSLATATATPQENGQALDYHVIAEDDTGLQYVAVTYGDQTQEWNGDQLGRSIDKDGQLTDLGEPPENGQVVFTAEDSAGQQTQAQVNPDERPPEITNFQLQPTDNAGEIEAVLEGGDVGLEELALLLDGNPQLQQDELGETDATVDTTVDVSDAATVGETNTITAQIEDWNGNTTESEAETYLRKYDVIEDTRLDIGVNYLLWAGDKFGKCIDQATPTIGRYNDPIAPETTSKHIDQMQGHGITNVLMNFNGTEGDRQSAEQFFRSQLANDIGVRPIYSIKDYRWGPDNQDIDWKNDLVPNDMGFIRNNFLERDEVFEYEGRPVFNIWNASYFPWDDTYHNRIIEGWGGYENFTDDIRNHLQVNGKDPFIIGGVTGGGAEDAFQKSNPRVPRFLKNLDATTSWVAGGAWGKDNQATWDEVLPWLEGEYQGHREFAKKHDMEFVPMVFPGFDDRMNICWGQDRLTPRSQNHFKELLALADEYRTTNMIDIATWNDWTEGTQIEPGSFRGTDYGTEYLDIVQEFQSTN